MTRRIFGQGLDAILTLKDAEIDVLEKNDLNYDLKQVLLTDLEPSRFQPRRVFDSLALKELAESIKAQGLLQPIIVRQKDAGYEIIAGERRWRASHEAGLSSIPALVVNISDESALAVSLIENIQRENLNPIEEAEALKRLVEECQLTHEEVSVRVGKPRSSISNSLRLLELPPSVRQLVTEKKITMGHAKVLLILSDQEQIEVANKIVHQGLNVRKTEQLVKRINSIEHTSRSRSEISVESERLLRDSEQAIFDLLEIENTIKINRNGKGCININFESEKELRNIIKMIGDRVK